MMFPQAVYAYNSGYDGSSFPADVNAEKARLQGIWAHPGYGSKGQITEAAEIYYFHDDLVTVYLAYSEAYPATLSSQNREGTYTYEISELNETLPLASQAVTGWRIMIDREQEEYEYWDSKDLWDPERHDEKQYNDYLQTYEYHCDHLRPYVFHDGAYHTNGGYPVTLTRLDMDQFNIIE